MSGVHAGSRVDHSNAAGVAKNKRWRMQLSGRSMRILGLGELCELLYPLFRQARQWLGFGRRKEGAAASPALLDQAYC